MKQYFLYDENSRYLSTNYYEEQPVNSTEVAPQVNTNFALWNGTEWIDTRTEEEKVKAQVPFMVTRRQLKLQLVLSGFDMSGINALIESLPEPDRSYAKIGWEDATIFERTNPQLNAMAQMLGLSEYQLDLIFIEAEKL